MPMSTPTDPDARPAPAELDRHLLREVGQVVRALEANGRCTEEELAVLVGAPYWERNRYHRVLEFMRSDGLVTQDEAGVITLQR
jgi:hypothetical protein